VKEFCVLLQCYPIGAMELEQESVEDQPAAGPDLFRKVLRLYPLASPHDYFRNGHWLRDVLEIDLELLEAHRREASAPDPIPLEEVELPSDMPTGGVNGAKRLWVPSTTKVGSFTNLSQAPAAFKPLAPTPVQIRPVSSVYKPVNSLYKPAVAKSAVPVAAPAKAAKTVPVAAPFKAVSASPYKPLLASPYKPLLAGKGVAKAVPLVAGKQVPAQAPASTAATSNRSTGIELGQIDEFISQHALPAVTSKICLAKLPAPRRRWVLQNFDGSSSLEDFIQEATRKNAWAQAAAEGLPLSAARHANTSPGVALVRPLKRPLSHPNANGNTPYKPLLSRPGLVGPPSKVPKLGAASVGRSSTTALQASAKASPKPASPREEPGSLIRSMLAFKR